MNPGDETVVYPLLGKCLVTCDMDNFGEFGTKRKDVTTPVKKVLRYIPTTESSLTLTLKGDVADFLVAGTWQKEPEEFTVGCNTPLIQSWDIRTHIVGKNTTHERKVTEVQPPHGYRIQCGETLNIPGGWSSFPAHADPETAKARYDEHEEIFFVVTPGMGYMILDGYWNDGSRAQGIREARNGEAFATPLGSHPIVFSPGDWGWYFWCYLSTAITKTYNQYADECGLREYVQ